MSAPDFRPDTTLSAISRHAVQAECAAWFDALPESLRDSATAAALQEMIDLDLDSIAAVQPPLGYGRD